MISAMSLNHRALVIGVGGDLPPTVDDAEGLAAILTDASRCAFRPDNVVVLTENAATKDSILKALDTLAKKTSESENETVIVFFSGHGYVSESDSGDGYWLMPNGYNLNELKKTAIDGATFVKKLNAISAARLLLLLDCCHAQGIAQSEAKNVSFTPSPMPEDIRAQFARGKGRVMLSSCKSGQVSYLGKPYSLFTRAVIEALCGANLEGQNGDAYTRVMDVASYAARMVPMWSQDKMSPQHPEIDLQSADNFVVAYYAGGEKKPKPLDLPSLTPQQAERDNAELRQRIEYHASHQGSGAIGQGRKVTVVGKGGIVSGSNSGVNNTGTLKVSGNSSSWFQKLRRVFRNDDE
jgi:hypothetical protein